MRDVSAFLYFPCKQPIMRLYVYNIVFRIGFVDWLESSIFKISNVILRISKKETNHG